jgi:hypothetical protein
MVESTSTYSGTGPTEKVIVAQFVGVLTTLDIFHGWNTNRDGRIAAPRSRAPSWLRRCLARGLSLVLFRR